MCRVRHHPARDLRLRQHNVFALAFALARENELAAEQLRIIGGKVTEDPWVYIDDGGTGDPSVGFCKILAIVQRAVSR
ncbi:hypothetical protein [Flindersiella endophytica]